MGSSVETNALVRLVAISRPVVEACSSPGELIAYCARVSNPGNQANTETAPRLLRYLVRNQHWSPLEMASMTVEINTTRDIARQILRHRSFSFQEFCVAGSTKITLESPSAQKLGKRAAYTRTIEHLYSLQQRGLKLPSLVRVFDERTRTFVTTKIREVFQTGVKSIFRVTLANGRSVDCTKEHKFLTGDGFLSLEDAVGLRLVGRTAAMSKPGAALACNGAPAYRDESWRERSRGNALTIHWSTVEKVEYLGEQMTYDMEVEHESHNYVANGIVTHNSQRYAVAEMEPVLREARLQHETNRQASVELPSDSPHHGEWALDQRVVWEAAQKAYGWALQRGVAKEVARALLPEGLTRSRLYMAGTLRSWVHYVQLRTEAGTQKEHRQIAEACKAVLLDQVPELGEVLG